MTTPLFLLRCLQIGMSLGDLDLVTEGSKILDLGCGEGHLMQLLQDVRHCHCQGVELNSNHVNECVKKGLFVYNDDLNTGLEDYPDKRFDYVILSDVLGDRPDVIASGPAVPDRSTAADSVAIAEKYALPQYRRMPLPHRSRQSERRLSDGAASAC